MEPLKDPKNDRKVKSVKPPPHKPIDGSLLFPSNKSSNCLTKAIPNWTLLKQHLHNEGRVGKNHVKILIEETNKILSRF